MLKLAVIGGGGARSVFLAKSLVQSAAELNIGEIVFMDSDVGGLEIYAQMAAQVARRINPSVNFRLTPDAKTAVMDADYVITAIRVGGDEKRIQDERIALSRGVLGQETTGAAGFSYAMRSVPVLADYCKLIERFAKPGAKMFNFTNPVGVVSQALSDLGYGFSLGICDAVSGLLCDIAKLYGVSQDEVSGRCFGLNHLSFLDSVLIRGAECLHELIEDDRLYAQTEMKYFDKALTRRMGLLLNEYLYYYLYPEIAVSNIQNADKTRGEIIRDINAGMKKELSGMDIQNNFDGCLAVFEKWYGKREAAYMTNETGRKPHKPPFKFDIFSKDAGGYAGVALNYIKAEQSGKETKMVLCVPNNGAIAGLQDGDVVEISCAITKSGYIPDRFSQINDVPMELIRRVKTYERLASKAIRTRCRDTAAECLMLHPLVNSYSLAKDLCRQYIKLNEDYAGAWQ